MKSVYKFLMLFALMFSIMPEGSGGDASPDAGADPGQPPETPLDGAQGAADTNDEQEIIPEPTETSTTHVQVESPLAVQQEGQTITLE